MKIDSVMIILLLEGINDEFIKNQPMILALLLAIRLFTIFKVTKIIME